MRLRNDLCWCGSGKKYKKCHLHMDEKLKILSKEGYEIPDHRIIYSDEIIEGVRKSSEITKGIFKYLEDKIVAGIKTSDIDRWVHDYTVERNALPATLGYNGFTKSCCTSVNDVVCHGIPSDEVLKDGDIINIDLTTNLDGYFSDSSRMYMIGEVSEEARRLVEETYECMMIGIGEVKPYNTISNIGKAIEKYAIKKGYSVVEALGGHGIGVKFHEEPFINHFETDELGMIMVPGMMFTIEPMINEGSFDVKMLDDGWTIKTIDGSLSAQWEHTILVTEEGYEILTLLD
ncbi:type I methionyl aminopeptidase [Helicovermis profundi]|uniref:Methionine aminopeptidase n=1 Tax=Helicovermis profundi TaxID=3065157 RepID=A0AAU9E2A2_9FIRM|nr:methionyl aminopeptidase [Clostridia bacterium S502]